MSQPLPNIVFNSLPICVTLTDQFIIDLIKEVKELSTNIGQESDIYFLCLKTQILIGSGI